MEGIMKCNAVKNGQVLDMALYSLTRQTEDYLVRRLNADEIQEKCCVDILRNKGESLCQGEQTRNLSCTDLRRLCWNEQMMTTRLRCRRLCRRWENMRLRQTVRVFIMTFVIWKYWELRWKVIRWGTVITTM